MRKLTRAYIVSNLYSMVALLAMFSFGLGTDISDIAHNLGRGDHQLKGFHAVSVCLTAVAIPVLALATHTLIQRLSKLASAQTQNDTLG